MLALQKTASRAGLELVEVPEPEVLKPDEVLIEVDATGICGSDLAIDRGSSMYEQFIGSRLPVTPGNETSRQLAGLALRQRSSLFRIRSPLSMITFDRILHEY